MAEEGERVEDLDDGGDQEKRAMALPLRQMVRHHPGIDEGREQRDSGARGDQAASMPALSSALSDLPVGATNLVLAAVALVFRHPPVGGPALRYAIVRVLHPAVTGRGGERMARVTYD